MLTVPAIKVLSSASAQLACRPSLDFLHSSRFVHLYVNSTGTLGIDLFIPYNATTYVGDKDFLITSWDVFNDIR